MGSLGFWVQLLKYGHQDSSRIMTAYSEDHTQEGRDPAQCMCLALKLKDLLEHVVRIFSGLLLPLGFGRLEPFALLDRAACCTTPQKEV